MPGKNLPAKLITYRTLRESEINCCCKSLFKVVYDVAIIDNEKTSTGKKKKSDNVNINKDKNGNGLKNTGNYV